MTLSGSYEIGFARADITVWEPDMCMLGWGMYYNRAEGVAEPLHARAMVARDDAGGRFAYVCTDLLLMSLAVRQGVLDALDGDHPELGLDEARVMLTATHNHSGPAGYSHYFWKNIAGPGFSQRVLDGVVRGIVEAIVAADRARRPGRLRFLTGAVPTSAGIAFNRSWFAYNSNHDVTPVSFERRAEAVDATMKVLRFDPDDGGPGGMLSWFPIHGTCVHAENRMLHPDHKGLACEAFESRSGAFGIFAQEACGDVTPNHRLDDRRGKFVGRFEDDYDSAAWVAKVEAEYAHRTFETGTPGEGNGLAIRGPLSAALRYVDFGAAPIEQRFAARAGAPATTRPSRLGVSMALGTAEGPGPLYHTPWVARLCNGLARVSDVVQGLRRGGRQHDPQWPLLELDRGPNGRLMGIVNIRSRLLLPLDPSTRYVKSLLRADALSDAPWLPQILPCQIFRLGPLAIAAVPFEPTTVAGRRLRRTLLETLAPAGVEAVVLNPYANGYGGYLTTYEEYQLQHYEAGYTIFGPWELAAVRTAYAALARELLRGGNGDLQLRPPRFGAEHMAKQAYSKPWPAYGTPA